MMERASNESRRQQLWLDTIELVFLVIEMRQGRPAPDNMDVQVFQLLSELVQRSDLNVHDWAWWEKQGISVVKCRHWSQEELRLLVSVSLHAGHLLVFEELSSLLSEQSHHLVLTYGALFVHELKTNPSWWALLSHFPLDVQHLTLDNVWASGDAHECIKTGRHIMDLMSDHALDTYTPLNVSSVMPMSDIEALCEEARINRHLPKSSSEGRSPKSRL